MGLCLCTESNEFCFGENEENQIKIGRDKNKQNGFILLSGIGYILQFIGDLIFLEIIILNFCGLKNNTKPEVIKRDIENNDLKAIFDNESFSALSENNSFE